MTFSNKQFSPPKGRITLYHATSAEAAKDIGKEGLRLEHTRNGIWGTKTNPSKFESRSEGRPSAVVKFVVPKDAAEKLSEGWLVESLDVPLEWVESISVFPGKEASYGAIPKGEHIRKFLGWKHLPIPKKTLSVFRGVSDSKSLKVAPEYRFERVTKANKKEILDELARRGVSGEDGILRAEYTRNAVARLSEGVKREKSFVIRGRSNNILSAANVFEASDALDVNLLGSLHSGTGGGREMIKALAKYSKSIGTDGAIKLTPLRNTRTIDFYIRAGFDLHPTEAGRFYLSPEMARQMGYIK